MRTSSMLIERLLVQGSHGVSVLTAGSVSSELIFSETYVTKFIRKFKVHSSY